MNTRKYSSTQEKRVATILGGKQVSNSGATAFNKGDVKVGDLMLVECKTSTTPKDSFSIKLDWLQKNREEAFAMGIDYPVLAIDFGQEKDYFVVDEYLLREFISLIEERIQRNEK